MGNLRVWEGNSFAESVVWGSEKHWRVRKPLMLLETLCVCQRVSENGGFGNWI